MTTVTKKKPTYYTEVNASLIHHDATYIDHPALT